MLAYPPRFLFEGIRWMNVLFLTLLGFDSLKERGIYTDLLREFVKNGHIVYAISPIEKREGRKTYLKNEENVRILRLQIGNIQKTNFLEKGISTVMIESKFKSAIQHFFSDIQFDLIIYSTPPITFVGAIEYVKKRDKSRTYLLLKDIFPQNAVDIGLLRKKGVKNLLYRYFRNKEKRLYAISDYIGCMSQSNVDYVLRNNSSVADRNNASLRRYGKGIIEVCPNSIEPIDLSLTSEERISIRERYGIPVNKMVFAYGGNLGKPQGIDFMLDCLKTQAMNEKVFFLIIGNGTEYEKIEKYIEKSKQSNVILHQWLPKKDYDKVVAACDVGMIFLDHRFSIPNFPSRLLSYMQVKLPVLAVTDPNTDVGKIIMEEDFGWWCESNNLPAFCDTISHIMDADCCAKGENAYRCLLNKYTANKSYCVIYDNIASDNRQ